VCFSVPKCRSEEKCVPTVRDAKGASQVVAGAYKAAAGARKSATGEGGVAKKGEEPQNHSGVRNRVGGEAGCCLGQSCLHNQAGQGSLIQKSLELQFEGKQRTFGLLFKSMQIFVDKEHIAMEQLEEEVKSAT
jgi:hypothetical protein